MIEIDGFLWFVGAVLVCGWHWLHICDWRREQREYVAWREKRNTEEAARHAEVMRALSPQASYLEWDLKDKERGQA